jgi:curli biogenesis system outer membrane secretion channel CsgG
MGRDAETEMSANDQSASAAMTLLRLGVTGAVALTLVGCFATAPTVGGASGNTVTGAAAGEHTENANSKLEQCPEALGTLAVHEDQSAPWWYDYYHRYPKLGSTVPVLRTMIQQSNCFVVVERGRTMENMKQERALEKSGELRQNSNFGAGQMVAADYTMRPSIQFSAKGTEGLYAGGVGGGLIGGIVTAAAGSMKSNEAATTLLLIDNRSGVQLSAAEGNAKNFDFGFFGGSFLSGLGGAGASGYGNTPEGKVIVASFADSYNQMVKALRHYKAGMVKGGLGTGGRLGVDGGSTPASKEISPSR